MKRFLQRFLALMVLLTTVTQINAQLFEDGFFSYHIMSESDKMVRVVSYLTRDLEVDVTVPEYVNGYRVVNVGGWCFSGSQVTSVTLPSTIKEIEQYAFSVCYKLKNLELPQGLQSLGEGSLYGTSFENIFIPKNVSSIGPECFRDCIYLQNIEVDKDNEYFSSYDGLLYDKAGTKLLTVPEGLSAVVIPEGVTSINPGAFTGNILKTVKLPSSIASVSAETFTPCYSIESVEVDENNPYYCSIDGILTNKDKTEIVCVPSGLVSVIIPEGATSMLSGSIAGSSLKELTLPTTLSEIPYATLAGCNNLKAIICKSTVPPVLTESYESDYCPNVYVPEESLEAYKTAEGWSNFNIYPDTGDGYVGDMIICVDDIWYTVLSIENKTAAISQLSNLLSNPDEKKIIEFPDKVKGLTVVGIKERALSWNGWTETYILPTTLKYIGDYALEGCPGIKEINLPEGLDSIGYRSFANSGLETVTLPVSLKHLGAEAFADCTSLKRIEVAPGNTTFCSVDGILYNAAKTEVLCIPAGYEESTVTIPEGVTTIPALSLCGCYDVTEIRIPSTIENIEPGAFVFSSIKSITIDEDNKNFTVKNNILYDKDMSRLIFSAQNSDATIPETVSVIDEYAFANNKELSKIIIPDAVKQIKANTFFNCVNLTDITFGESIKSIHPWAFSGCPMISEIIVHNPAPPVFGESQPMNIAAKNASPRSWTDSSFSNEVYENATLYVPAEAIEDYMVADVWRNFSNIKAIPAESTNPYFRVTGDGDCEMTAYDPTEINDAEGHYTIPATAVIDGVEYQVTRIADKAFYECQILKSLTIGGNIVEIGASAFDYCDFLTVVKIDTEGKSSGIEIGEEAFRTCRSLKEVYLGASVKTIGRYCFAGENQLTTVTCSGDVPATVYRDTQNNDDTPFSSDNYLNTTLIVNDNAVSEYKATAPWKYFDHIIDATTGIMNVGSENVSVKVSGNSIIVSGAENGISVFTIDGRVVYTGTGLSVDGLAPGIYLVRVEGTIVKVAVK